MKEKKNQVTNDDVIVVDTNCQTMQFNPEQNVILMLLLGCKNTFHVKHMTSLK